MVKIYQQPFAHAGAKQVIPDASDPQGFVSNADGFTTDYELPDTDPNYKPIERAEFNGLMNMVTESLGEIQQFGFAKWQPITWSQGSRVVEGGVVYRALVQTSQQPPHADWVREMVAGWCMPDYSSGINITSSLTAGKTWTAPENGILIHTSLNDAGSCYISHTNANHLLNYNLPNWLIYNNTGSGDYQSAMAIVRKNLVVYGSDADVMGPLMFYPFK